MARQLLYYNVLLDGKLLKAKFDLADVALAKLYWEEQREELSPMAQARLHSTLRKDGWGSDCYLFQDSLDRELYIQAIVQGVTEGVDFKLYGED